MTLIPGIVASAARVEPWSSGELLTNGGFETGDLTGWSDDEAGFVVATDANAAQDAHDLEGVNETPRSGSYAAWGTLVSTARISQSVDVSAYATGIDAGTVTARASVFARDTYGDADNVIMALTAKDGSGTELQTWIDVTGVSVYGSWGEIVEEHVLPSGTRTLEVAIRGRREAGSIMNVGIDDASLTLSAPTPPSITLYALSWSLGGTVSDLDWIAPNLIDLDEGFTDFSAWTKLGELNGTASASVSGGVATLSRTTGNAVAFWGAGADTNPVAHCMEVITDGWTENGAYNVIIFGFVKDTGNFLVAEIDPVANVMRMVACTGGGSRQTFESRSDFSQASGPLRFLMGFNKGSAYLRADYSAGQDGYLYTQLSGTIPSGCSPWGQTGFKVAIGISSDDTANEVRFRSVRSSPTGRIAVRDQALVSNEDGTPYEPVAGKLYWTASLAMNGSVTGVLELDKTLGTLDHVAMHIHDLGTYKTSLVAGHLVRCSDMWRLFMSGWASNGGVSEGCRMFTAPLTDDPLSGVYTWDTPTALSLPLGASGVAAYDPCVVWDGTKWLIAYAITDHADFSPESFYPALCSTTDFSAFTLIGADATQTACEGPKLMLYGGEIYFVTATRTGPRIYDDTLTLVDAPAGFGSVSFPVSPPHVAPYPDGSDIKALRFNGIKPDASEPNFVWGEVEIWNAV